MITLLLGGEKSGKSALGLRLLEEAPGRRFFIGTAQAQDQEMRRRINAHRQSRPPHIPAREADLNLAGILREETAKGGTILVDSLDFWLFSCLQAGQEPTSRIELLEVLHSGLSADLILVSLEAGLGPVAASPNVRAFARALGLLNQQLAAAAQEVLLVVAGLTVRLKGAA